jgi:DNA-binding Xre family transcriptional regulator
LWVELQIAEICYACEDDGTADGIPDLLQRLPTKLEDIYRATFQRMCDDEKFELARKVFQWVMYARRPMTLKELEDAVSVSIDQKFWKEPSVKLRLSNLSRICWNLLSYDELDGDISRTSQHRTVPAIMHGFTINKYLLHSAVQCRKVPWKNMRYLSDVRQLRKISNDDNRHP